MVRIVDLKNNAVRLPKTLVRQWRGSKVRVTTDNDHILIERVTDPSRTRQEERMALWERAAGMLKGKLPKDPVAWQRKMRREWERDLPWPKR